MSRNLLIAVIGVALILGVALVIRGCVPSPPPSNGNAIAATVNYSPDFCTDDRLRAVHYARGATINGVPRVIVRLREGCFAGPYFLPDDWSSWDVLPVDFQGKREEWWVGMRFPSRTIGPRGANVNLSHDGQVGREVYLQGKEGEYITFIRTNQ
jgi:hypothetical protein